MSACHGNTSGFSADRLTTMEARRFDAPPFPKPRRIPKLTSRGKTERAYGTLKPDDFIDDIVNPE